MSEDRILLGIGLVVVLAVGSQILAHQLRVPSLIVLLPAGFTAGALTDIVHPDQLAPDFTALVSLAVAVILYDAGLGLDLRYLKGETRSVVARLIALGVLLTWGACLGLVTVLFDVPLTVAVMVGVILVVSGPTVVGPRPAARVWSPRTPGAACSSAAASSGTPWRPAMSVAPAFWCGPPPSSGPPGTTRCSSSGPTAGSNRSPRRGRSRRPRGTPSCSSDPYRRTVAWARAPRADRQRRFRAASRVMAASMSARCVNACGKLPS